MSLLSYIKPQPMAVNVLKISNNHKYIPNKKWLCRAIFKQRY